MTDIKILEKTDFKDFKKPDGRELIFIPKEDFLEWYKTTKGIEEDIEMVKKESYGNYQECPNCKSAMKNYIIKTKAKQDLWHLCHKCNLTFSEKRHDYFTMMILKLIKE